MITQCQCASISARAGRKTSKPCPACMRLRKRQYQEAYKAERRALSLAADLKAGVPNRYLKEAAQ